MAPGQEANDDNSGKSFRALTQYLLIYLHMSWTTNFAKACMYAQRRLSLHNCAHSQFHQVLSKHSVDSQGSRRIAKTARADA